MHETPRGSTGGQQARVSTTMEQARASATVRSRRKLIKHESNHNFLSILIEEEAKKQALAEAITRAADSRAKNEKRLQLRLPLVQMLTSVRHHEEHHQPLDLSLTTPQRLVQIQAKQRAVTYSMAANLLAKDYMMEGVIEQAMPLQGRGEKEVGPDKESDEEDIAETQIIYRHHHHHYHHHWFPFKTPIPRQPRKVVFPCSRPREFAATTVDSYLEDCVVPDPKDDKDRDEKKKERQRLFGDDPFLEDFPDEIPFSHEHNHYHTHVHKTIRRPPPHQGVESPRMLEGAIIPKAPRRRMKPHHRRKYFTPPDVADRTTHDK